MSQSPQLDDIEAGTDIVPYSRPGPPVQSEKTELATRPEKSKQRTKWERPSVSSVLLGFGSLGQSGASLYSSGKSYVGAVMKAGDMSRLISRKSWKEGVYFPTEADAKTGISIRAIKKRKQARDYVVNQTTNGSIKVIGP